MSKKGRLFYITVAMLVIFLLYLLFIDEITDQVREFHEDVIVKVFNPSEHSTEVQQVSEEDFFIMAEATEFLSKRDKNKDAFFFIETSHVETLKPRLLCALESVAKLHPDADVYFLIVAPPDRLNLKLNQVINELKYYKNINFLYLNINEYFKNTPLENWYQKGILNTSGFIIHHTCDVLRALTVWKYGGTFLDIDLIIIKSLKGLKNYVSLENDETIASGIINLELNNPLSLEILQEINKTFDGSKWTENGPVMITRVFKRNCENKPPSQLVATGCKGVTVFPVDKFNKFDYTKYEAMFDENSYKAIMQEWKDCSGIHFWNQMSSEFKITLESNQPLGLIAQDFCPRAYLSCDDVF